MDTVKRFLGVIWMLIGIAAIVLLIAGAVHNIDLHGKADINKPVPWIIIITIFTPISIGLVIFGWYALKGEYDRPGPASPIPSGGGTQVE
jgi:purine-cytosine permease-like protein